MQSVSARNTRYSQAVTKYLRAAGHATNTQILDALRADFPDVSPTTVHRVTARLAANGRIAKAPNDAHGNLRYDANTRPHHHFYCSCCQSLRDIPLNQSVINEIERQIGGCKLNGQLLISGACEKCFTNKLN